VTAAGQAPDTSWLPSVTGLGRAWAV